MGKTKIRTCSLVLAMCSWFNMTVFAAGTIDYSDKLSELKNLISECEKRGIAVDYAKVNYATIELFQDYINQDIEKDYADYNISCMEELYNEAKSSLIYSTEINTASAKLPDMSKTRIDGGDIKADDKPVFSVGYGHFAKVREDIPRLNNFGATNIQTEIGPTMLKRGIVGWDDTIRSKAQWYLYKDDEKGNSLRFENSNGSVSFSQTVKCTPSSNYKFGIKFKYENGTNGLSILLGNDKKNVVANMDGWRGKSYSYATSENETELTFTVESTGTNTVCIDEMFIYEVDDSGNQKGENLLKNAEFEKSSSEYSKSVEYIISALESAEENNIGVCLLLSPHYFPKDLSEDIYCDKDIVYNFNIDAPKSREVIENYLRTVLPLVKGYNSLDSICLSNEPNYSTQNFPEFYNPKFREYLKNVHGNIESLNRRYKSNYLDFSQIFMPSDMSATDALCYDWMQFNDKTVADWHKWMAGIVKEYLPEIPVHAKILNYFVYGNEPSGRDNISRGTDIELFNEFCDYAGNDSCDFKESVKNYYVAMFMYDYQNSVLKKPIYNSEEHVISDGNTEFSKEQLAHSVNSVWQGAVHGRDMSSLWVWERTENPESMLYNSILNRPDVVAGIGKTSLDLTRLSKEVTRLQNEETKIAVYYSKPSRVYDKTYTNSLFNTYRELLNLGVKVGVVSDLCIENLSDYDTLIIPGAENCTLQTSLYIKSFINNGGEVLYMGNSLSRDEYNNPIDNSFIRQRGNEYTLNNLKDYLSERYIYVASAATGEIPEALDWRYSADDKGLLINMTNLEFDTEKKLSVYYKGKKLDKFTDLITNETVYDGFVLEGYKPRLLYFDFDSGNLKNVMYNKEDSNLSWNNNKEQYKGVNLYSVSADGEPNFEKKVNDRKLSITEEGTFLLKPFSDFSEGKTEIITITDDNPFLLNADNAKFGSGNVTCEIEIKNEWNDIAAAVLNVSAKDIRGNEVGEGQYRLILRPGQKDNLKISVGISNEAKSIVVSVWDSLKGKNEYAEAVTIFNEN